MTETLHKLATEQVVASCHLTLQVSLTFWGKTACTHLQRTMALKWNLHSNLWQKNFLVYQDSREFLHSQRMRLKIITNKNQHAHDPWLNQFCSRRVGQHFFPASQCCASECHHNSPLILPLPGKLWQSPAPITPRGDPSVFPCCEECGRARGSGRSCQCSVQWEQPKFCWCQTLPQPALKAALTLHPPLYVLPSKMKLPSSRPRRLILFSDNLDNLTVLLKSFISFTEHKIPIKNLVT